MAPCIDLKLMERDFLYDFFCTAIPSAYVSIQPTKVIKINAGSKAQKSAFIVKFNPGQYIYGNPSKGLF